MPPPPCELAEDLRPQTTKTLVAKTKGASPQLLSEWAASRVVNGAGAYAIVEMPTGDIYAVIAVAQAMRVENAAANMKAAIEQLPGGPQVEWVRPLTRRLQRLFCWGDAGSTSEDVARAAIDGNVEELAALVPQAAGMIMREEVDWQHLAALHTVSQGAPIAGLAIQDQRLAALEDRADRDEEEDGAVPLRVVHEAFDQHTWSDRPNLKRKCMHCDGWDPYECECGMLLCELCRLPSALAALEPICTWRQHPTRPTPFYVHDHTKWPEEEKLLWIRQEIGDEADLTAFAETWLRHFGPKIRGEVPQKAACLRLFAQYRPPEGGQAAWKNESDLPPEVLEQFQRVWDPDAPQRCRECSKASAPGRQHPVWQIGKPYCSEKCRWAGFSISCMHCSGPVDLSWPYCAPCKWGIPPPAPRIRPSIDELREMTPHQRSWAAFLDRSDEWEEDFVWRMFFTHCDKMPKAIHEPAWKRRRRS